MRRALKSLEGVRTAFRGTVVQFGMKSGYTGRDLPTLMLKDVMDGTGNVVTDHLWLSIGKQLAALHLQRGDVIAFQALVTAYEKGYILNEGTHFVKWENDITKKGGGNSVPC